MAQTVVTLTSQGRRRSVRTGFSWPAFLVPTLWALSEGLWRQCAFSLLTVLASRIALDAARIYGFPFLGIVGLLLCPLMMLTFGRFGNRWLLSQLTARGWA